MTKPVSTAMLRLNANYAYVLLMISAIGHGANTDNRTMSHNQPTATSSVTSVSAHHWNNLPAHKRQHLLAQYHHLQHLAPSEQKSLHQKVKWFQGLSPTEQAHLRQLWQHLTLDERQDWLRRMQATPAKQQPALRLELLKELNQREV